MPDRLELDHYEWGVRWHPDARPADADDEEWMHSERTARIVHQQYAGRADLIRRPVYLGCSEAVK